MSVSRPQSRLAPSGVALIAVMWVVIVAGLMLIGVQRAVRVNLATAHSELASVEAHWLARAGIEQALAILEDDSTSADDALEYWYSDDQSFENVEMLNGTFSVTAPPAPFDDPSSVRYGLIDHCSRLDINVAPTEQLGAILDLAGWQVSCILDWRDGNNDSLPGGAEAVYYASLKYPYLIRNGPFHTIAELLLVHGIDRFFFSGEDTNLNGTLDTNEDDSEKSYPDDDGNGQLSPGLAGLTTVYCYERNRTASDEDRVNVNTADKDTLVSRFNFTDALAQAIIDHKPSSNSSSGGSGQNQSSRFNSLMDLLDVKAQDSNAQSSNDEGKVKKITVQWLADNLDELTLTDDERLPGRININTASKSVLMALPRMTTATAETIVQRQAFGKGPFMSVGELFTDKVVTEDQFKAFAEQLTVRSAVFEIRSTGLAATGTAGELTGSGIRRDIIAIVDRGTDPVNILYWYQSE